MATSPEEQHSEEQPEEEEEEEGNKKTVTEEKRPHESAKKNDDSDSQRDEKKLKENVDGAKDDKNPRNVQLEADQLKPSLVRLEHDPETQLSFWTGMRDYHRINGVYPFERQTAMEDFLNNWLLARVLLLDFQQAFQRLRQRYTTTGAATGGTLNSLDPPEREVFLLTNKILFAYYTVRREKKRKIQETSSSTFSKKQILIGGSKVPAKEPEKPLKQQKKKMVLDTKLKQKMPKYLEKEEVNRRENPEEKKRELYEEKRRENHVEEQKENPEEKDDSEEAWTSANFDVLYVILHAIADYQLTHYRFPYDDASDMEDFVKNWLRIDLSVNDCLAAIKRLKKYYVWKVMDQGLFFPDKKQEQLYNSSDILWNLKAHSEDEEFRNLIILIEGGENLEWKHPDIQRQIDFFELDYVPDTRLTLPFSVKNSFQQGTENFSGVKPTKYPVPLAMLWPPILPFQVTAGEGNNQQKAGTGEDSSSMNKNDPGGLSAQCDDDPGKPHDGNPEALCSSVKLGNNSTVKCIQ
ncbi:hypothetical protein ACOSQ2_030883 [Xanthoceras sorbifolium]